MAPPSLGLSLAFAVACLLVATLARWALAHVRPDVYFTPYFPAVFFAAAFGGFRIGIITALVGGVLGVVVNFGDTLPITRASPCWHSIGRSARSPSGASSTIARSSASSAGFPDA